MYVLYNSFSLSLFVFISLYKIGIENITIDNIKANYELSNYLETIVPENEGIPDPDGFKTVYKASLDSSDDGELLIEIPNEIRERLFNEV